MERGKYRSLMISKGKEINTDLRESIWTNFKRSKGKRMDTDL